MILGCVSIYEEQAECLFQSRGTFCVLSTHECWGAKNLKCDLGLREAET